MSSETAQQRRLRQFGAAVAALARAMTLADERPLTEIERAGAVQFFELSWERGWKTLKDEVVDQGLAVDFIAPNTIVRAAFAAGMIDDGDAWVEAGRTRNLLTHSYDTDHVEAALVLVRTRYLPLLQAYLNRRQTA